MTVPIRGKVARVLSLREIVINVGTKNGVEIGMYFDVMDPKGEDIRDPDTNEILGSIERPKARIQVTKVQEKLSVASTYRKQQVNIGGQGPDLGGLSADLGSLSRALIPPRWITKYETLRTEETTWEDLDEKDSYVKVGDPVVQVVEEIDVEEENAIR